MRKLFNTTLAILAAGLMLGACEKNTFPEVAEHFSTDSGANVKFFFHVDGAPRSNFYLDNMKVTGVSPTAEGLVLGNTYGSVYPSNAYAVVPSGDFTLSAIDTASANGTAEVLTTTEVSLEKGKNYSAYLVGTTDNYEAFVIEDKLPPADNVSIYWRFVNTMANMPFEVDVYAIRAAEPATETTPERPAEVISLGSDIGFKEHGEYVRLDPGSYTYKVFAANTEYDPLTSTPYLQNKVTLASLGRVYTTQIRGNYAAKPKSSQIDYWRDR